MPNYSNKMGKKGEEALNNPLVLSKAFVGFPKEIVIF